MTRTPARRLVRSESPAGVDPIVARTGGLQLRWHARTLRGDRTIAQAAKVVGLNRDELARIERGETTQIRFETLVKLLAGYGCRLQDLFEVEPDTQAVPSGPQPLYTAALVALETGVVESNPPSRRAVRRSNDADILRDDDETVFAPSREVRSARRRAPVGTMHPAR